MSANKIIIQPVEGKQDLKRFVDFPYSLYKDNPYWVPPLRNGEMELFEEDKNPAFEHCEVQLFLAIEDNKVVGRIAAIINNKEQEQLQKKVARFGWIDFVEDERVSRQLLKSAEWWARQKGCTSIKGPYGFSNMDKAGMLIDGFDELATMAVIYNYPYYPEHMDKAGYEKLVDWKEFEVDVPTEIPQRVSRFAKMIKERYGLHEYKPKGKADLQRVGREIFALLNTAYADLEGFIPHSGPQIDIFIKKYLSYINPDFLSIVYDSDNKLAGFGITMPSFSRALQKAKGKLLPFGLWHITRAMKKNDRVDLYLIAVRPDLQNKGITALIFNELIETFIKYNIKKAETNPEMESNQDVQNLWKGYEMRLHKRRRCYIKNLI